MVAFIGDDFSANPRTLCDWVKNFRIKRIQMKRKLRNGGDLRVCAILSTALISAEHELRRKQQERFNRWLEMQSQFDDTLKSCTRIPTTTSSSSSSSSSSTSVCEMIHQADVTEIDDMAKKQKNDEITNLWRYELSSLDEFMKNISNKSGYQQQQQQRVQQQQSVSS